MNRAQELWWIQAKSDYAAFDALRRLGSEQCHCLHFLQMATEKIAKAYFWRSGSPPPKTHAGFVQFLRFLGRMRSTDQKPLCGLLSFARFADFENWIRAALPVAYELERLAPDLANSGPNPEYPWPNSPLIFALIAKINLAKLGTSSSRLAKTRRYRVFVAASMPRLAVR